MRSLAWLATALILVSCSGGSGGGEGSGGNQLPLVNAGQDLTVEENTVVTLMGSASDADGSVSSTSWSQISGPTVTLTDNSALTPDFMSPDIREDTVLVFRLTVTDNSGGSTSDDVEIRVTPVFSELSEAAAIYSNLPTLDTPFDLVLDAPEDLGSLSWEVVAEPTPGSVSLTGDAQDGGLSVSVTTGGAYSLQVTSEQTGGERLVTFYVGSEFAFDPAMTDLPDGQQLEESIVTVLNQAWVDSAVLSETQLRDLASQLDEITVVGFDGIEGLLVQFDHESSRAKEQLLLLSYESGVSSVALRVVEGEDINFPHAVPDDGSDFDDGGDNWHLERIEAVDAWDISKGSNEIRIGISDSGFDSHKELKGRTHSVTSQSQEPDDVEHGNGSAGAIGAITDNKEGMSGINWVSKLTLGANNFDGLIGITLDDAVVSINSSLAWAGYIDSGFDPTNNFQFQLRKTQAFTRTRKYRKLIELNPDVLFVASAGNGIGNGIDGVEGFLGNPALHNTTLGTDFVPNAIFVAALVRDLDDRSDVLAGYSNFGTLVEIAAPTNYKSLAEKNGYQTGTLYGFSGGYSGTSAAAPTVTGVASLIYSMNPAFTGADVKEILISSATEFVTERYIAGSTKKEKLNPPIPILNARAALEMAQGFIDAKVARNISIVDAFEKIARIEFISTDPELEVVGAELALEYSDDGGQNWITAGGISVTGDTADIELLRDKADQRVVASVTLRELKTGTAVSAEITTPIKFSIVGISAIDTVSLSAVNNPTLSIEHVSSGANLGQTTGSVDGSATAFLQPGSYRLSATAVGYQDAVKFQSISSAQSVAVEVSMTPTDVGEVGAVGGRVLNDQGLPIAGATVRISGGIQTNGFFAAASTDENGTYLIDNVSKTDASGAAIDTFFMEASKFGFTSDSVENVIVLPGKETNQTFFLNELVVTQDTLLSEGFEAGAPDWTGSGFWNVRSNGLTPNTLVDDGYTSLAPDEDGNRSFLPDAVDGQRAAWYGQSDTGTFIGQQASGDTLLSGGTSVTANSGTLTSPVVDLTDVSQPVLRFSTWWEIESVNPNESGFDLMEIQISTDGVSFETIRRLNPFVDPNDTNRDAKPFSSAGYNRSPVWVLEEIDLTQYIGTQIYIRFRFNTVDELYNGFRGWVVDDVRVDALRVEESQSSSKTTASVSQSKKEAPSDFYRIHKMPRKYQDIQQSRSR